MYCCVAGRTALDVVKEFAADAKAIVAWGSCASNGCIQAAKPNPTSATPIHKIITDKPINKVPGCPPIGEVMAGTIVHLLAFGTMPELDRVGRPKAFYSRRVHDTCYRRPNYDAGLFVESWDDENARKGYCLYKMGCRGPVTYNACAVTKWNNGVSFPIQSGHGCIGCSEENFWDNGPFYNRLTNLPGFGDRIDRRSGGRDSRRRDRRGPGRPCRPHLRAQARRRRRARDPRITGEGVARHGEPHRRRPGHPDRGSPPHRGGGEGREGGGRRTRRARWSAASKSSSRAAIRATPGRSRERACGVCTTVHALASVRAVEDALGIAVPPNAELIRNLMFGAQYLQDHVVHFYHLHALDWVDVVSALKADPKKTSEVAQSISDWPHELAGVLLRPAEATQ